MTHRAREGDMYAVPLGDGRDALCRVLYKSSYFKHVALIGCYGIYFPSVICSCQMKAGLLSAPLYTTVQPTKIGNWRLIENCAIAREEIELSRRLVGGEVWLADKHLGLPDSGSAELPKMDTYGERIFIKKLAALLSSNPTVHSDSAPAALRR